MPYKSCEYVEKAGHIYVIRRLHAMNGEETVLSARAHLKY